MAGGAMPPGARVKHGYHIGSFGNPYEGGGQPGKGITSYGVCNNRLRPFHGFLTKGIFNTMRRARYQIGYIVPPFVIAYYAVEWAIERNEYLNSKAGRAEFADSE